MPCVQKEQRYSTSSAADGRTHATDRMSPLAVIKTSPLILSNQIHPYQHIADEERQQKGRIHVLFHGSEAIHHPHFRPPHDEELMSFIGGIEHQRAPIDTSIRAGAVSVIPLSYHLLIFNPNAPLEQFHSTGNKSVCLCVCVCVCVCMDILVERIQPNKGSLHPRFAKFLFLSHIY